MIKELTGLKCKAVAVKVPDFLTVNNSAVFGTHLCCNVKGFGWSADILPEGSWTILGRANEIDSHIKKFFDGGGIEDEIKELKMSMSDWANYCTANNLTNQLILINNG